MNFRSKGHEYRPLHFHVTPFVDILLVLLAFFILTWSMRQNESDLQLKLPEAQNARPEKAVTTQVIVNIRKGGDIIINQRTLTTDDLKTLLSGLVEQNPKQLVTIRADQNTDYKNVLQVLDICRGAKVTNIGFAAMSAAQNNETR
ncbi:MAG: biopolymer transporter ExbD [Chthoniobacterales bacterium]